MLSFLPVLLLTFLGAIGSYNFKLATNRSTSIPRILLRKELYIGSVFYLASILMYIISLRTFDLSVLLPQTAITYIWSMALSFILLKEKITSKKIAGAMLIFMGFVVLSFAAI